MVTCPSHGWRKRGDARLGWAAQASACLPGAFAPVGRSVDTHESHEPLDGAPEVRTSSGMHSHGHSRLKGVAEPPCVPTPGAIANAIAAATGTRVRALPMTPERVWGALHAGEEGHA